MASTTLRLWIDRHFRRRPLVLLLSALVAMALGAGVTLAFTQRDHGDVAARSGGVSQGANALQVAAADRQHAASWIVREVAPNIVVACDSQMCNELQKNSFAAARLMELQPSAPDPLGAQLVVATPVIRNQFGTRLATVYAPLVIASFGSGPERVDVRYIAPDGSAAFESQLATQLRSRIAAGRQLLTNKRVQATPAAAKALLAGQVDPRLLVTLSTLAALMPLHLVAFDDPSPGASSEVPLRGAELGAATSAALPAMVTFFNAQQNQYAPAVARMTQTASGQSVVTVRYDAPGPMGLGGS